MAFEVCLRGELSDALVSELGATRRSPSTTIIVPTIDRAELHGVIRRLEELGLELVSIHELSDRRAAVGDRLPDPGDDRHG
jgi:cell division FtsZ-interacting protein ZapD